MIDGWGLFGGGVLGAVGGTASLEVLGVGCGVVREGCRLSEAGDSMMRSRIRHFCRFTFACRVSTYISSRTSLK